MALTDVQAVRLKTGDKSVVTREVFTANGSTSSFKLNRAPVLTSPTAQVWKNNTLLVDTVDYTLDLNNGILTLTASPAINDELVVQYYWSVFSDEEVQYFIDESSSDVVIASARLLLALAADKAKVAIRETLQGGGGMGAITKDTSVAAKELRETAKALVEQKIELIELEGVDPADQFTEIAWTEMELAELDLQGLIRAGLL